MRVATPFLVVNSGTKLLFGSNKRSIGLLLV